MGGGGGMAGGAPQGMPGAGGGMPGMGGGGGMAGGMGGGGAAQGEVEPNGIITGVSGLPDNGVTFTQWANYAHEHQLGLHQGYAMVHWVYGGHDGLPAMWVARGDEKPEEADLFRRQLEKTVEVDRLVRALIRNPEDALATQDLAREYVGLPGEYMTEYMLARLEQLVNDGWAPKISTVRGLADQSLSEQAKGKDHTGGDQLVEFRNYLSKTRGSDRRMSVDAWLESPSPGVWLAVLTALRRCGQLPVFYTNQYANGNQATAAPDGSVHLATTAAMPGASGDNLSAQLPAYAQLPPEHLEDQQLKDLRDALVQMVESGVEVRSGRVVWSRLMAVELELRDRRKASAVDDSWEQIMTAWKSSAAFSSAYGDAVMKALDEAMRDEITALRAINEVDAEVQLRLRSRGPAQGVMGASEVGTLRDYLKKRPDGRIADQARYMLALMLENEAQGTAAREQYAALKPLDRPPHWWRWGRGRWEQFQAF